MYSYFTAITWGVWLKSNSFFVHFCLMFHTTLFLWQEWIQLKDWTKSYTFTDKKQCNRTWTTFGVKADLEFKSLLWDIWTSSTWVHSKQLRLRGSSWVWSCLDTDSITSGVARHLGMFLPQWFFNKYISRRYTTHTHKHTRKFKNPLMVH